VESAFRDNRGTLIPILILSRSARQVL